MDIVNFVYVVWSYIKNFPLELKWDYQNFVRGYSDRDVWNLSSFVLNKVRAPLKEFVQHQAEEGMILPNEFATDPAAWLEILQKIEFSIDHAWKEENELDYNPIRNMGIEEKEEFYKKVDEGFLLFGKYLRDLWD